GMPVRFRDLARIVGDRMISWSLETRRHACCLPRRFVAALLVDTATAESRLQTLNTPTVLAAPPDHREDVLSPDRPVHLFLRRCVSDRRPNYSTNIRAATVRKSATLAHGSRRHLSGANRHPREGGDPDRR
ncbi:MAG: hypothetical protein R3C02_08755, partial [Planctomycetaceae bacterium]